VDIMDMNQNTKRDLAAIAGGMALGVLGSRLLAPLIASASGSIGAKRGHDPFEQLIRDHRKIMSTLQEMEAAPRESWARRGTLFLQLKRTLAKHAMAEEDIVYPVLHDDAGDAQGSKHLYEEHADMKIHLFELERMLKNKADWAPTVRQLRNLIEKHIQDEENVEFPKVRNALSQQGRSEIAGQIHREEALVL
jgi:iron-sulfur cluster repair protein YtfE (RIC family)